MTALSFLKKFLKIKASPQISSVIFSIHEHHHAFKSFKYFCLAILSFTQSIISLIFVKIILKCSSKIRNYLKSTSLISKK